MAVFLLPGGPGEGHAAPPRDSVGFASGSFGLDPEEFGAGYGAAVAPAGDVNGDGFDDLIVGAPRLDTDGSLDNGAVFVYHGAADGAGAAPAWTVSGGTTGDRFGTSVAGAGDVNGDGFADVVVGAPNADSLGIDEGAAYLFLGSATGLEAEPVWVIHGGQARANLGKAVAGAGDVDGDGYGDVLIGAPGFDGQAADEGRAFLFAGGPAGLEQAPAWTAAGGLFSSGFGEAVAGAGDVNGDGFGDVVIGSPLFDAGGFFDEGRAYLFLGGAAGLDNAAAWSAESLRLQARFGAAVAGAGDVNADGFDDVIVGAPGYDGGRAYLYIGSPSGLSLEEDWFVRSRLLVGLGTSVAGPGDVDGDGIDDLIVGAPRAGDRDQPAEGFAYVHAGSDSGAERKAFAILEGDQPGANLGGAVSGAGDLNGDGFADFAVGAPAYDNLEQDSGRVFVHLGAPAAR
jgi:hypothetical protein